MWVRILPKLMEPWGLESDGFLKYCSLIQKTLITLSHVLEVKPCSCSPMQNKPSLLPPGNHSVALLVQPSLVLLVLRG